MKTKLAMVFLTITLSGLMRQGLAQTCENLCDGHSNTAYGNSALASLTTGQGNTAIGSTALLFADSNSNNTAIGNNALYYNKADNNTAIGVNAMVANRGGTDNTAVGINALNLNVSGNGNTALGFYALSNYDGDASTAIGFEALMNNNTGFGNTAVGYQALSSNTGGDANAGFGYFTLESNSTGNSNTAFGYSALTTNISGGGNTAYGHFALINATGSSNIAVGDSAGQNLTSGSNNIDIGNAGKAGESKTIRIGTQGAQSTTFVAGISAVAVTGRQVLITSNGKLGVAASSARFKEQIRPMDKASEAILALKPVTFHYKEEVDSEKLLQFGLIAEDVEKVDPDLVARDEQGKAYTVRYEAVNAMLLNEFLKEHRKLEQQQAVIAGLTATLAAQQKESRDKIASQDGKLAWQQQQIDSLTSQMRTISTQVKLTEPAPHIVSSN